MHEYAHVNTSISLLNQLVKRAAEQARVKSPSLHIVPDLTRACDSTHNPQHGQHVRTTEHDRHSAAPKQTSVVNVGAVTVNIILASRNLSYNRHPPARHVRTHSECQCTQSSASAQQPHHAQLWLHHAATTLCPPSHARCSTSKCDTYQWHAPPSPTSSSPPAPTTPSPSCTHV